MLAPSWTHSCALVNSAQKLFALIFHDQSDDDDVVRESWYSTLYMNIFKTSSKALKNSYFTDESQLYPIKKFC